MKIGLSELFEREYDKRNDFDELSYDKPDPLLVAREQTSHYAILLCALYGYGSAKKIVEFFIKSKLWIKDRMENKSIKTC